MRNLCIDPYTPEELKEALRQVADNDFSDPTVNWTGEYGIIKHALERIEALESKLDKIAQVIEE